MEPRTIQPGGCTSPKPPQPKAAEEELREVNGDAITAEHIAAMALVLSAVGLLFQLGGISILSAPVSFSGITVGVAIVRVADRRAPRAIGALAVVTGAVSFILMASDLLGGL